MISGRQLKPIMFAVALLPLLALATGLWRDTLGANPIEAMSRGTGEWTLRLLLITLAISTSRRLFGWRWVAGLRRTLGLFTWFYATLHLFAYLWLDQFLEWTEILVDVLDRPFITAGLLAWLLMTPLALTSNNWSMRYLGRNWGRLHKLAYIVAGLGVLHFWWLVKVDVREPLIYMAILFVLLAERVWHAYSRAKSGAIKKPRAEPGLSIR